MTNIIDIEKGHRYRVTFEAEAMYDGGIKINEDGTWAGSGLIAVFPTRSRVIKTVEEIEPPIVHFMVGDQVKHKDSGVTYLVVEGYGNDDTEGVVVMDDNSYGSIPVGTFISFAHNRIHSGTYTKVG